LRDALLQETVDGKGRKDVCIMDRIAVTALKILVTVRYEMADAIKSQREQAKLRSQLRMPAWQVIVSIGE
jgi:hypothetical protein